jgi:putative tryptophan/tyrosine transport system substrate-binding protein
MKRRQFITLVGGAAAAWPLSARAQQSSNKIPVVGVLWHGGSAEEEETYLSVLVKAFNELGYIDGKNIRLEHRFPCRKSRAVPNIGARTGRSQTRGHYRGVKPQRARG